MKSTKSKPGAWIVGQALPLIVSIGLARAGESGLTPLWEIGRRDRGNAEFALAPGGHGRFADDGFFVVGASDSKLDWPYVHPGPVDTWAGSRRHSFRIVFCLSELSGDGACQLRLEFLDTHSGMPPTMRVEINGKPFERALAPGAGDASVMGDPSQGRPTAWELEFASSLLQRGDNEIVISALKGSWALYDVISLTAPVGTRLGEVGQGVRISAVEAPPVWLKEGGEPRQPVNISLHARGEVAEARFLLNGREVGRSGLRSGMQRVSLRIAPENRAATSQLEVRQGDELLGSCEMRLSPPRLREIWVLPHSHVDIGYTHLQDEVIDLQIANLLQGMDLARATVGNPDGMRFKWNPEATWVLEHFLERATDEQRAAFVEAVRRGDVGVDGLYANMLTGLCRPEELAQCFRSGMGIAELTGVRVDTAAICDVPGWTWGLVTMMGQAGIKYFMIGPNYSARIGTIHRWDNRPFYWQSPSGRERVLSYVVDNYHFCGDLEENVLRHSERLSRSDYAYDLTPMFWVGTWPGGGVDNAPPDEQLVAKAMAWNEKYAAPRVVIGLASEFFHEFERRHGAELPQYAGDLTPYWEDGAGSTAKETALNRASAERLAQAETLYAMVTPGTRNARQFQEAWKNVLLYSEHTWGAHNSISEPDAPFVINQWRVKQAFALDADRQSRDLLDGALSPQGRAPAEKRAGAVDVFNTTQWLRTDLVLIPADVSRGCDGVADDRGRAVPAQRLATGDLAFIAREVPAFGARRFRLTAQAGRVQAHARAEGLTVRTSALEVELDGRTGAIAGLRCRGVSDDFVDRTGPVGVNDFRYVLGTNTANAQGNGPVSYEVIDAGPLVVTLRLTSEAPGCHGLVRIVRVIEGLDRVEIVNHVDRQSVREKDSVHFGFGFQVPGGTVRMETPWAVVRPNKDQLPGACRNWFTVQRWVDVSNAGQGITLAPLDAPLLQVGGMTANLLGPVAWEEWLDETMESTTLYSWAQNNHWFTNYKADQMGVTTFRYALRPHRGGYKPSEAVRFGVETSRPLIAMLVDGSRPIPGRLLAVESPDVLVETVKVSEDGKAIVVRLFGVSGRTVKARLEWKGFRPTRISRTDLAERPLETISTRIEVPGYGVTMVRAEL